MATGIQQQGFELRGESTSLRGILRDLWRSRELLNILAKKDFFVRYRRASFGLIWVVGLPLVQASVLAVVLSRIVRFETPIPFPVYVFSGILPWQCFAAGVTGGTGAIIDGNAIATRIYFPRAIFPLVVVRSGLYGFFPGLAVLLIMAAALGVSIGPEVAYLLPGVVLLVALASGFALVLSAVQVYFRDVKHILSAIMLPWFWLSGVFFPLERLGSLATWIQINPTVGVIQLFRASLGTAMPGWERAVWISCGWAAALLVLAALLHRRFDRVFVDLL